MTLRSRWPENYTTRRSNVTYLNGKGVILGRMRIGNYTSKIRFGLWETEGSVTVGNAGGVDG